MASKSGISGLGVAMAASGAFLMYAGIRDVPLLEGARELLAGKLPAGNPPTQTVIDWNAGSELGATVGGVVQRAGQLVASAQLNGAIVQAARKYVGIMYHFGGAQNPNAGFDCSGLVNWVLGHDLGLTLPGQHSPGFAGTSHGPVTTDYFNWSGAKTVSRSDIQAGDLLCGGGHIGIATGGNMYIDAPTFGERVHETTISWTLTPLVRRVTPQAQLANQTGGPVKAQ